MPWTGVGSGFLIEVMETSMMDEKTRKLQEAGIPDFGIKHHLPTPGNKVYIKQMHLIAGQAVNTHKHAFEHYAILGSGKAVVDVDGVTTEYIAPCVITVEENATHKISALTDITWFCVHATDEVEPEEIEKVIIVD